MNDITQISIIVPVYNAEIHLSRCISSILSQTFTNIEIVLIDDGSTDSSGSICKYYAKQDHRIKLISQNNSGPSIARNKGIDIASGEWILFVDADDWIAKDYLDSFEIKDENSDMILGGYSLIVGEKEECSIPKHVKYAKMNNFSDSFFELDNNKHLNFPWGKMFKRSLINRYNIRFNPKYCYGEDKLFVFNYLCHLSSIKILAINGYKYCHNEFGLARMTHDYDSIKSWHDDLLIAYDKIKTTFKINEKIMQALKNASLFYFTLYKVNSLYDRKHKKKYSYRLNQIRAMYNNNAVRSAMISEKPDGIRQKTACLLYKLKIPFLTDFCYWTFCRVFKLTFY